MAAQKPMSTVSFRLPKSSVKSLKRVVEYTRWVQALVLKNLGLCPYCTQKLPGSGILGDYTVTTQELSQKEIAERIRNITERAANLPETVARATPRREKKAPQEYAPPRRTKLPSMEELLAREDEGNHPSDAPLIDWLTEQAAK